MGLTGNRSIVQIPRTWQLGQLEKYTEFLVSRSLTLLGSGRIGRRYLMIFPVPRKKGIFAMVVVKSYNLYFSLRKRSINFTFKSRTRASASGLNTNFERTNVKPSFTKKLFKYVLTE